jgi:aryl-alcohol dehydrogenase-like predicted oxidoreductase
MKSFLDDETLTRVQRLKAYVSEQGHTLASFSLAWCLRRPEVSSVIIGATTPEQVETNVSASGIELPAEVWERAEAILAGTEA